MVCSVSPRPCCAAKCLHTGRRAFTACGAMHGAVLDARHQRSKAPPRRLVAGLQSWNMPRSCDEAVTGSRRGLGLAAAQQPPSHPASPPEDTMDDGPGEGPFNIGDVLHLGFLAMAILAIGMTLASAFGFSTATRSVPSLSAAAAASKAQSPMLIRALAGVVGGSLAFLAKLLLTSIAAVRSCVVAGCVWLMMVFSGA